MILFQLIGGAGILLYAIDMMKWALGRATEHKIGKLVNNFTKNRVTGIITGAVVTMVNQKSSATTIKVVGLVNAGVLTLVQATAVIMGANIGTTVTGQLLAFKLGAIAPGIVGIGVIIWRLARQKKVSDSGKILIGFGLMFIGMDIMRSGLAQIRGYEIVRHMLELNETFAVGFLLIIVVGFILSFFCNGSSILIGVMIAMAMEGMMDFSLAMPIVVGANIGKCIPALRAGKGTNRTAKRAAAIHFMLNIIGGIIYVLLFRNSMDAVVNFLSPNDIPRQIAWGHTLFNIVNTILLFPFTKYLVILSGKIVSAKTEADQITELNLDKRLLETPGLALAQASQEITVMAGAVLTNYQTAFEAFMDHDEKRIKVVLQEENAINSMQKEVETYLMKLFQKGISERHQRHTNMLISISADIERMGDMAEEIANFGTYCQEQGLQLSEQGKVEVGEVHERVAALCSDLVEALNKNDAALAQKIIQESTGIENVQQELKQKHIERLNAGVCTPGSGAVFMDVISSMLSIVGYIRDICNDIIEDGKER